ncbi:hypothetical protein CRYUN_Cryun04dG0030200 [Craigia yunnanensis]
MRLDFGIKTNFSVWKGGKNINIFWKILMIDDGRGKSEINKEMDENGRVHPGCANAANPYHECGVYCLEKVAEGKGRTEKDKTKFDNRYGIKEVVRNKRTDDGGRVQPNCPKASNPYHECNEFCIQRTSRADAQGVRKESDNRNGIKQGELSKKMDEKGRVHPTCRKASNPYHECDENCFKRTTEAIQGVKKESDIGNGIKQGELSKKKDERTVYPTCPKASNPYHECCENCFKRNTDADTQGVRKETGSKLLDASRSFGRKKKGSESQPMNPRAREITPAIVAVYPGDPKSLRSHFSRKKMEAGNGESFSSSEQQSEEIYSHDQSFDKAQIQYSQSLSMCGKIMSSGVSPTKLKEAEKVQNSPKVISDANTEDGREYATSSNFSFSGIVRALKESDEEEEVESVISDSCVSVGKYHVKASISSILQSIFNKYGDIAANCRLESASMRAYYLECLCAVVQELHSTSFEQLTKAKKVKEMFAVLKDVESANIDVSWLRALLNEISEAVELVSQRQTFEAKKIKYDRSLESVRKELESQMEDLAQKEKEAADVRKKVAETKARLDDIEHECSQLNKTISSIVSIKEKFQGKSLANVLFVMKVVCVEQLIVKDSKKKMEKDRRVHPDCINASNAYHECVEYCFRKIAEAKARKDKQETETVQPERGQPVRCSAYQEQNVQYGAPEPEENSDDDNNHPVEENIEGDVTKLTGRQKKLFELRLMMNEARKANQTAMVAEKKRMEAPPESRGISKQKWLEERKKKIGKLLDANGLDLQKAYMLDTQEAAEAKYKKWEKDPAPFGWDVFNQKTLYNAYKKRTKNIGIDLEEYNKMKEADPEFYREASSLQYGKEPKISEDKIDKMVKELKDREEKRNSFSRRRKFHEEKDIDSINDRNEHFNKKIERAFGKYTLEIKNNLERGTALPD